MDFALFRNDHSTVLPRKEYRLQTQDLTIGVDGGAMPSFIARPDGEEPRAAVIVLQEIFGVNKEVRRIAELFANAGYVALAINYYHRTHPNLNEPYTQEGLQAGFAAAGNVGRATLRADVSAAIAYLQGLPFVKSGQIATVGVCFGGSAAFVTATLPGLAAAIPFYGGSIAGGFPNGEPAGISDAKDIRVPLLLFFGGKDDYIDHAAVASIDKALADAGKEYEIVTYPDVGHAFFRESSAALNQHEVEDAWTKVQSFLAQHLK
jgi:carboxymethylenebutenolidase